MTAAQILERLEALSDSKSVKGMARFGIQAQKVFGVSIPNLRQIAKQNGCDQDLAEELWQSGWHEARILASMLADKQQVERELMQRWVRDFDSWDLCDQCCNNLFRHSKDAWQMARDWTGADQEFTKRAGFTMMAVLAVHDRTATDADFIECLAIIKQAASDERNFVKKAVNWALRQIGKRNQNLNELAVKTAAEISGYDSKAARWIAADALRELRDPKILNRIKA